MVLRTIFSVAILLLSFQPIKGEVEKVVLKWRPGFCSETCLLQLKRRLSSMPFVAEMRFDAGQNQATLRWDPNRKFNYRLIDTTMRSVGVSLHEIYVTVRGTISHKKNVIYIDSLGDDTQFTLLSPISINAEGAAAEKSVQSHLLQPNTSLKLIQAEEVSKVVTIEGPLFEPHRAPPLYLVAERIAIPPSW